MFPNAACVASLVDRLVHRAEVIAIDGDSYCVEKHASGPSSAPREKAVSRRTHLPSGLSHGLHVLINADWWSQQAFAVFELLSDVRARIWMRYGVELHELIREQRLPPTVVGDWVVPLSGVRRLLRLTTITEKHFASRKSPLF